jgi:hypothetical protein
MEDFCKAMSYSNETNTTLEEDSEKKKHLLRESLLNVL